MLCTDEKTYQTSLDSGNVFLGRTLPSLLNEACDRAPNAQAFNQWTDTGWQPLSNQDFKATVEALALGLVNLGLEQGDRVALLMHSDLNFCIADLGCLLANLTNVPIDPTQTLEHIIFVLRHSAARALIISNLELLAQIVPNLWDTPDLQYIIVANVPLDWQQVRSQWVQSGKPVHPDEFNPDAISESACLWIPMFLHPAQADQPRSPFPQCIQLFSLDEIQREGQAQYSSDRLHQLHSTLTPNTLATIIYIPDDMGQMQGVMLTHENLSANALASFASLPGLGRGNTETVLTFLPLNHVLARTLLYGNINYGHSIYFSNPTRVMKHLKEVQPTILVTVPLFLEKIYRKVLEMGGQRDSVIKKLEIKDPKDDVETILAYFSESTRFPFSRSLSRWQRIWLSWLQALQVTTAQLIFNWALNVAKRYELGRTKGLYALLLQLADWFVFSKWRSLFGVRLRYLISGGAVLKAELANLYAAAGLPVLHGYGLTQASAVVCFNRMSLNRAGTVGKPIAGVEVAIAPDGEVLTRSPYVTPGYYKNPEATRALIDEQGWLHTGDLGTFTNEGFLKITGLKKSLFKLSTGKYIVPQPIEQRLKQSPLVAQAIAVGSERKFCTMLIAPNLEALHHHAQIVGFDLSNQELLKHPCAIALYQSLVDSANCHLPYWATVKRFRLLNAAFTVENGLLMADGRINRAKVAEVFAAEIDHLYREGEVRRGDTERGRHSNASNSALVSACPPIPDASCPAVAQSFNPRLTT
ncbi:AMP-binding protein [Leptolyngbya sp. FACHB-671]|uniref:AMP-dependent synthetase/ligase n=1 Tax=Leptolyngbya sp. FACHB-671 TaxID=2692812 RepID=UPI00168A0556|nr:AMP-binding protein [Leptolyngbya sp. FACHB-671]MBD2066354.1 AMP-binding protein [Leptolyngbya sp. FACHB-671]